MKIDWKELGQWIILGVLAIFIAIMLVLELQKVAYCIRTTGFYECTIVAPVDK